MRVAAPGNTCDSLVLIPFSPTHGYSIVKPELAELLDEAVIKFVNQVGRAKRSANNVLHHLPFPNPLGLGGGVRRDACIYDVPG